MNLNDGRYAVSNAREIMLVDGAADILNEKEANLIIRLVSELIDSGVEPRLVGIIAPYAAQVRLIRDRLGSVEVEVDTVDGFQGREKEAILVSMVRSNDRGEIGFLSDTRRSNVARLSLRG